MQRHGNFALRLTAPFRGKTLWPVPRALEKILGGPRLVLGKLAVLRALRNIRRQNVDKSGIFGNGLPKFARSGPYAGLLLGAFLAMGVAAALAAGAVLAHLTRPLTGPYGPYVRLPADFTVITEKTHGGREEYASLFPDREDPLRTDGSRYARLIASAALRTGVFSEQPGPGDDVRPAVGTPTANKPGKKGIVHFSRGRVSIETTDGSVFISPLRQAAALPQTPALDPLDVTLFAPRDPVADPLPALLYGEVLDSRGLPSRWTWRSGDFPEKTAKVCDFAENRRLENLQRLLLGVSIPAPGIHGGLPPDKYHGYVSLYAEKYDLAAALMLAIMHTESNFNPFAVSPNQAVGLMQIVPDTAGNEVYRYLMGTHGTPSMESLFSPEYNIKYGAIYLHLLGRRYFARVSNAASRQLCIIAAYNGGPNAVLRLFDPDPDAALERINTLSPEQVYAALTTEMPNAETRRYVEIVMNRLRNYSAN